MVFAGTVVFTTGQTALTDPSLSFVILAGSLQAFTGLLRVFVMVFQCSMLSVYASFSEILRGFVYVPVADF